MSKWLFPWSAKNAQLLEELKVLLDSKVSQDNFNIVIDEIEIVNAEIIRQQNLQQEEILEVRTNFQTFAAHYQIELQNLLNQAEIDPSQLTISQKWIEHFLLMGANLQEYYIEVNRMVNEFKSEKESLNVMVQRNLNEIKSEIKANKAELKAEIRANAVKIDANGAAERKIGTILFWIIAGTAAYIGIYNTFIH